MCAVKGWKLLFGDALAVWFHEQGSPFWRTANNGCPVRCPRSDGARHASPIWVPAQTRIAICWSCDPRCDVVNRCSRIDPVRLYWYCEPQWLVVEQNDNGKPVERRGRKASGLRASQPTTAGPPKVHASRGKSRLARSRMLRAHCPFLSVKSGFFLVVARLRTAAGYRTYWRQHEAETVTGRNAGSPWGDLMQVGAMMPRDKSEAACCPSVGEMHRPYRDLANEAQQQTVKVRPSLPERFRQFIK